MNTGEDAPSGNDSDTGHRPVASRHLVPAWVVHALVVLGALVMLVASLTTWLERQALDTDNWVAAADELLENDQIRAAVAAFVVDELYESVDVEEQLAQRLPEDFEQLAGPVAAAVRQPAADALDRLLERPQVQAIWEGVNRRAHEALVRVLRDETVTGTSAAGGTVSLQLGQLVEYLAIEVGLPDRVVDAIPPGAGEIVVVQSDELDAAQAAVAAIDWGSALLFFAVVALFSGAVALATGWRRAALRNVGLAAAIVGLLLLVIQRLVGNYLVDHFVEVAANRGLANTIWLVGTSLLRGIAWNAVVVGAAILLAAVLGGPSQPARAIRGATGPHITSNPVLLWSSTALLYLVVVLVAPLPVLGTWYGALVAALVLAAAAEALRRRCELDVAESPT